MISKLNTQGVINLLGPLLCLLIFLAISATSLFSMTQSIFLSIFSGVVYFWLFSNIPLFVTGFIGVSITILLDIAPAKEVFSNFGHPIIFLFLGGFLVALAFNKVGLDRRIALFLLSRDIIAHSFNRLLFALLFLTGFFSMWISNTATTAMMLPLVLGILKSLNITSKKITSLILISVAYASSIGGIATPVGSTPNIISLGMLEETIQLKIGLLEWIRFGLPISLLFLVVLFVLAAIELRKHKISFEADYIKKEYAALSPISKNEYYTLLIFSLTVLGWLLPSFLKLVFGITWLKINPGALVMLTASLLFVLGDGERILKSEAIRKIDWGSLMLFGSGLALGKLLFDLNLAQMAGGALTNAVSDLPLFFIYLISFAFVIFATELTSNTATASILLPIMISLSVNLNLNPFFFAMGISLACSLAFMLPVATPPNAIVYGSRLVRKKDMFSYGLVLNILFSILLAGFIYGYQTLLS